jgi:hypothetical protein
MDDNLYARNIGGCIPISHLFGIGALRFNRFSIPAVKPEYPVCLRNDVPTFDISQCVAVYVARPDVLRLKLGESVSLEFSRAVPQNSASALESLQETFFVELRRLRHPEPFGNLSFVDDG